jgi:dipeptidyl aminopeptidase/acylaminoacyl peptidase
LVREADARAVVGTTPLSGWPPDDGNDHEVHGNRSLFYLYCRQQGVWTKEVAGYDPVQDREALIPYCPRWQVRAAFPPTLLLHGDADDDVPYEQSVLMAEALVKAGIPHRLLTIPHGEHMFDLRLEDPVIETAFTEVLAFLAERLSPSGQR